MVHKEETPMKQKSWIKNRLNLGMKPHEFDLSDLDKDKMMNYIRNSEDNDWTWMKESSNVGMHFFHKHVDIHFAIITRLNEISGSRITTMPPGFEMYEESSLADLITLGKKRNELLEKIRTSDDQKFEIKSKNYIEKLS